MKTNLDSLKDKWKSIDINVGSSSSEEHDDSMLYERLRNIERATSAKDKLQSMLWIQTALCLWGLAFIVPFTYTFDVPVYTWIVQILFFLTGGVFNFILLRRLKRYNYSEMTVTGSIDSLLSFVKLRARFKTIMISFAIPVLFLIFMVLEHEGDQMLLWGGGAGVITGVLVGIGINRSHKKLIAQQMKILKGED